MKDQSDEEDDYLKMSFDDPQPSTKNETLTQRKKRLARETEERSRPKSKAQLAEEERQKRDSALKTTTIDTSSKGFKMMAALGYKPGTALGKDRSYPLDSTSSRRDHDGAINSPDEKDTRLLEPISLEMREGRSGIGADAEKKRKFREEVQRHLDVEKRRKVDADEFRERQQKEREEQRHEGQLQGAMKVAERLDEEDENENVTESAMTELGAVSNKPVRRRSRDKKLSSVNVFWRALVKQRAITERDKLMRHNVFQSLSSRPEYSLNAGDDDPEEDRDDRIALGKDELVEEADSDVDKDDPELEAFEQLDPGEKLHQVVEYLRKRWHYCFWCKYRYTDSDMEGCPGLTEEDHD